jgi:hypothetical protein
MHDITMGSCYKCGLRSARPNQLAGMRLAPPILGPWSNLHAGPDYAKASSRQAAYAAVRRDAHAEVEQINGWLWENAVIVRNAP